MMIMMMIIIIIKNKIIKILMKKRKEIPIKNWKNNCKTHILAWMLNIKKKLNKNICPKSMKVGEILQTKAVMKAHKKIIKI